MRPATLVLGGAIATWIVCVVRLRGMDAGPGTDLGGFGWYLGVWTTITAAMMLPAAAPMVIVFHRVSRSIATSAFVLAQKVLPRGDLLTKIFAVTFVAAGTWVALAPASVPGLT